MPRKDDDAPNYQNDEPSQTVATTEEWNTNFSVKDIELHHKSLKEPAKVSEQKQSKQDIAMEELRETINKTYIGQSIRQRQSSSASIDPTSVEYNLLRKRQLESEISKYQREDNIADEDILRDLENLLTQVNQRLFREALLERNLLLQKEVFDNMNSQKYPEQEQLEELGKMFFALLKHLGLIAELEEKKSACNDNHCQKPDCVREKIWHIRPKPKDYEEKINKIDDLIMTEEEE